MSQVADILEFADLSLPVRDFISRTQKLYIDGRWVAAASGKTFDTIDPASEQVICKVAEGGREDVDRAAKAAHKAFYEGEWPRTTPAAREPIPPRGADLREPEPDGPVELESVANVPSVQFAQ